MDKNIFFEFTIFSGMILRSHRRHMRTEFFEKTIALKTSYFRDAELKKEIDSMPQSIIEDEIDNVFA